jgi:hypothetical protein
VRATYCMHCGRHFEQSPDPDDPSPGDDYATGIGDSGGTTYDDGGAGGTSESAGFDLAGVLPWSDAGGTEGSDPTTRSGATTGSDATGESEGLLDPEGLADNALTLVVAVFAGLLIGFVSLFAFAFSLGAFGFLLALVAWLGSTVYLASRHTVFGAVRYGAYGLAVLLVLMPVGFAVAAGGSVTETVVLLVMFSVPFGIVAIVVGGIGYLVGLGAPGETDPGL